VFYSPIPERKADLVLKVKVFLNVLLFIMCGVFQLLAGGAAFKLAARILCVRKLLNGVADLLARCTLVGHVEDVESNACNDDDDKCESNFIIHGSFFL